MMKGLKGGLKGTQSWHRTHVRLVLKLGYPDDGLPCTYLTAISYVALLVYDIISYLRYRERQFESDQKVFAFFGCPHCHLASLSR
jgi:hypothetical protein